METVHDINLELSGIFLSIEILIHPIFSNRTLFSEILNLGDGSLNDWFPCLFLKLGLPSFSDLSLLKYCFENSMKSRCFYCRVAAETSSSHGLFSIKSDFDMIFGLGFVSLSYELNELTHAFHITLVQPKVFNNIFSWEDVGYALYLYARLIII